MDYTSTLIAIVCHRLDSKLGKLVKNILTDRTLVVRLANYTSSPLNISRDKS